MEQKLIFAAHQNGETFYGMNAEQSAELDAEIDKMRSNSKMFWGGCYLHGLIDREIGCDIVTLANTSDLVLEEYPTLGHSRLFMHLLLPEDGEYEVEVIGIQAKCVGFFWRDIIKSEDHPGFYYRASMRGLICYADDAEAIKYAKERLAEKSTWL